MDRFAKLSRLRPRWSDLVIVAAVLVAFHAIVTGNHHLPFDAEYYHYPLLREIQSLLSSGTLPAWDSYAYGGSPLLANAQAAWLYPPHLVLAAILGVLNSPLSEHTMDVVVVIHLAVAGLATGAIARKRNLGEAGAAYAGVFVVLTGEVVSQAQHVGMMETLPWIALGVLAVDYLATGMTSIRIVALAITVAMAITAGFTPLIPAMIALLVGSAVARPTGRGPALIGTAAGSVLGAAMAGAALIPAAALIGVYPPLPKHAALTTSTLITTVLPNTYGHWEPLITQFVGTGLTNTYFYLGGTAVVLLPVALTSGRAALWDSLLVLVLLLASFGAVGQAIANGLQSLPAVGALWRPEDVVYVVAVPLATLLARALARPPTAVQLAVAALALAVLVSGSFTGVHGATLHFLRRAPGQMLLALIVGAVALVVAAGLHRRDRPGVAAALAVAAIAGAADLALAVPGRYFISSPGPATSAGPSATGDDPSVLTFLRAHTVAQDRIAADIPNLLPPWAGFPPVWHLSDANGFQPQFSRYQLAVGLSGAAPAARNDREFSITPALRDYLEEMGVRYIIMSAGTDRFAGVPGYRREFSDALYHVYSTPWPHDRAYLVGPACLNHGSTVALLTCRAAGTVTTTTTTNTRRYRFRARGRPTLLATGEPWYPGWSATGQAGALPVHRVGFLTTVTVPAGVGRVTMSYWPPGLTIGAALSFLSIGGALLITAADRRRRRSAVIGASGGQ